MAYANLALLKEYEDIGATDTTNDDLLQHFLDASQRAVDRFCRQTFESTADTTRYFDPTRDVSERRLILDGPICTITSVTNGDGSTVSASSYVTEPRNWTPYTAITLKSNAVAWTYSSAPENAIAVVGRWAYSLSAPDDIIQATVRMASYLYRQRNNASDLDRAVLAGNATILPAALPRDIKTLLYEGGYRRMVV